MRDYILIEKIPSLTIISFPIFDDKVLYRIFSDVFKLNDALTYSFRIAGYNNIIKI